MRGLWQGPLAQSVEQQTFNLLVAGSIPARLTTSRPHRLAWPRTPAFHAGDRGSNPLGDANYFFLNHLFRLRAYMSSNDVFQKNLCSLGKDFTSRLSRSFLVTAFPIHHKAPMNKHRAGKVLMTFIVFSFSFLMFISMPRGEGQAMIAYARKTGKPCRYCHVSIGGGGKLTKAGKKFREDGYILREPAHSRLPWRIVLSGCAGILVLTAGFILLWRRKKGARESSK